MARKATTKVPDAWEDDDWEVQADKAAAADEEPTSTSPPNPQAQLSRAERLAQHAESNRKLWESAEAPPETFHYLASRADPPLTSTFKPAVKVLSRKPTSNPNDLDDDDLASKTPQLTPSEILAKQQREREEKQRRYDEARAKIFGAGSSNPSSGTSTPGAVTPPRSTDGGRGGPRGRGRGRGGGGHRYNESRDREGSQRPSSQSGGGNGRELYDPNYSPKPGFQFERRGGNNVGPNYNNDGGAPLSRRSTPREEDQIIRTPRGPDGSGRGGFGFAKRGAKGS
ncbi:uncharacterized protein F4822DRAFT_328326 [Hypoxylon trugodes]|uniref:uncharacterized protein n=1 Tax=Hypoxylon trugodes TaxID=326681 RepID=UPI00219E1257|nr:uncharacterized protein F4822DRAFT_328326 [Hypoxylon trugodes]KAI1386859.1 hypothetical protein F4822DRAFT_328326 [Hypoxylon trugodes]